MTADKKRINIAIDSSLHKELRIKAVEEEKTITDLVVEALKEKLERDEKQGGK